MGYQGGLNLTARPFKNQREAGELESVKELGQRNRDQRENGRCYVAAFEEGDRL